MATMAVQGLERKLQRTKTKTSLLMQRAKCGHEVTESQEVLKARMMLSSRLTERNHTKYSFVEDSAKANRNSTSILPRIQGTKPNLVSERWKKGQKNPKVEETTMDYTNFIKEKVKVRESRELFGGMWDHPSVTRRILRELDEASLSPRDRTYHWLLYQTE